MLVMARNPVDSVTMAEVLGVEYRQMQTALINFSTAVRKHKPPFDAFIPSNRNEFNVALDGEGCWTLETTNGTFYRLGRFSARLKNHHEASMKNTLRKAPNGASV